MGIQNAKGQIAIFVVLIFQVLFILFAMTINIALVVHDKINFQNSLDMAVYYGAKQQAEVLNAMAHINYQMRQNWKLLAWRYRILGTLAQHQGWPSSSGPKEYWCPQNSFGNVDCANVPPGTQQACNQAQSRLPYTGNYCDRQYFSCISADLWKRGIDTSTSPGQNLCTKKAVNIPAVEPLQTVPSAGFMAFTQLASSGVDQLIDEVNKSCPKEKTLNWLMTQFFLTHFRLDQRDRKSMIREIFNRSLKLGKDLDGKSIFEGAKKVFFNNLSSANRKNVQSLPDYGLKDFNSFQDENFDSIFKPVDVWPVLQFMDFGQNQQNQQCISFNVKRHYNPENTNMNFQTLFNQMKINLNTHVLESHLGAAQKYLFQFNYGQNAFKRSVSGGGDPIKSLILGFVKNKEKTLYYGLTGALKYLPQNQIFSLILTPNIELKGSAFAKAFGGRFGPQPHQMDHLIPVHYPGASTQIPSSSVNVVLLQPNHSRWPGDKWGLIARELHYNNQSNPYSNFLNKRPDYPQTRQRAYSIESFFHLIFYSGLADDPLSRPLDSTMGSTFMRMMELMALYPDVYDLSYYSIAGNYMQTYFPRICKLLKGGDCQTNARNKIANLHFESYIRGDFGWPETDYYISKNQSEKRVDLSIAPYFLKGGDYNININEITVPPDDSSNRPMPAKKIGNNFPALTQGKIFYPWLAQELPDHLLSSWASTIAPEKLNYDTYQLSSSSFLKCPGKALANMPVPSACASGGRSGYSVKLISCEIAASLPSHPVPMNEYCP